MKNKNIFLKIYIVFVVILTISVIVLSILGKKERIGYLSDFKLNIDNTLEINGLDKYKIKQLFTIDSKLDNISITNYIFTNTSITNYSYDFKIKYYDKVFRHGDVYGVYPNLNNLPKYIKSAKMLDNNGTPFGNLISSKIIDFDKIDNVNYILSIKKLLLSYIFNIIFIITFMYLCINFNKIILNLEKRNSKIYYIYLKYNNFMTTKRFIIFIISIGFILFLFQFWLVFPGYFQYADSIEIMGLAVSRNYHNWHPIIISVFLNFLYKIFGYNTYYIFLLNLVLWYASICIIIISLYIRFKHKRLIFLYLISFLGNIFFLNINHTKDSTVVLFFLLSYSFMFFILVVGIKKIYIKIFLCIFYVFFLIIAMLWRLNFIVTVYPMFIFIVYYVLGNYIKNKYKYFSIFITIMLIIAFILISISKIFPTFFIKDMYYSKLASNHLFLLQIAGCSSPANDGSMIPEEWYLDGKDFEDLKNEYSINKLNADRYGRAEYNRVYSVVFKGEKLDNLKLVWIKYIIKYPINYIKHILNFSFNISILYSWKLSPYSVTSRRTEKWLSDILDNFPKYQHIEFTPLKFFIYSLLYYLSFDINSLIFVILSILLFFFFLILFILKKNLRNNILFLSLCLSFSSFATLVIVCIFSPLPLYRYIYPIVIIDIISLISFFTFIYDRGGFKKFIRELRGNK